MIRILILAALIVIQTPLAFAQTADYTVKPLLINHSVAARDRIEENVTLTNNEKNRVIRLYASVHEITVGSDGEIKEFAPASVSDNSTTVTSWIEISRARQQLQPGESTSLPLRINLPPKVEPGEYHAFVGFGVGPNRDIAMQQVMNGTAPGVVVRLSIDVERNVFLRLARFATDRFVLDPEKAQLSFDIQNAGDEPLSPSGEVIFYDTRGNEVAALPVNDENVTIAPGKTHTFSHTGNFPTGLGRHKAFLAVEYGEQQLASIQDTVFFYLVPWQYLVVLAAVMLLLIVILTIIIYRRSHQFDEDDEDIDHAELPVYIRTGERSPEIEHDLDLKQRNQSPES